jgi:hypothetical protein
MQQYDVRCEGKGKIAKWVTAIIIDGGIDRRYMQAPKL